MCSFFLVSTIIKPFTISIYSNFKNNLIFILKLKYMFLFFFKSSNYATKAILFNNLSNKHFFLLVYNNYYYYYYYSIKMISCNVSMLKLVTYIFSYLYVFKFYINRFLLRFYFGYIIVNRLV